MDTGDTQWMVMARNSLNLRWTLSTEQVAG